jgi:predicted dienelactone hydrolase
MAAPPVADPGAPGPFLVGHTSFVLTDLSRPGGPDFEFRPVPVEVWYPVDAADVTAGTPEAVYALDVLYGLAPQTLSSDWEKYGIDRAFEGPTPSVARPFPLVVFSPGWGAAAWFHISLGTRLASHGFVVAILYHYGDWVWPWEPFDHLGIASWNRPRDVSFVLSDLLVKNEGGSGHLLSGTIRPDQVAASGWSLGGYASMVLAGGDDSVCDKVAEAWDPADPPPDWTCSPSWPDPRIRAIVPLDGSSQLLYFDELSRVTVPALGVGEEWSYLALDAGWEAWQARHHAAFSGKPAYRVDVFNSNHQSFSDMCESIHVLTDLGVDYPWGPADVLLQFLCEPFIPSAEAHRLTYKYMIAFLKTNLSGDPGYHDILTPGYALTREPAVEFFVTERKSPKSIFEDYPADFIYFPHQPGSAQFRAEKDPASTLRILRATEKR